MYIFFPLLYPGKKQICFCFSLYNTSSFFSFTVKFHKWNLSMKIMHDIKRVFEAIERIITGKHCDFFLRNLMLPFLLFTWVLEREYIYTLPLTITWTGEGKKERAWYIIDRLSAFNCVSSSQLDPYWDLVF